MNILIAEDETTTRLRIRSYIQQWGYEVSAAKDGAEALELFRNGDYPIVVSDWEMPNMDGLELVRRIRETSGTGYVYIILLTAKFEKEDLVFGMEAGADDFLSKPFDRNELRVRLRAGERIIELEQNLARQNQELEKTNLDLAEANTRLGEANTRMKNDLEAAAEIQKAFLPAELPNTPAARFAWHYEPCDELAGDTLNIIQLDEKHVGLVVLDVSGHGVPAALLSVSLSRTLSPSLDGTSVLKKPAPAPEGYRIIPPSEVAAELNQRFAWNEGTEQYFTLFYGILSLETCELCFVCAGHPSPIHVPRDAEPACVEASGFPIGVIDEAEFEDQSMQLEPGDRLYLYSDGIPEAENPDRELFGQDRLVAALGDTRAEDLEGSVSSLLQRLGDWRGRAPMGHDVSLVAVEIG